MPGFNIPAAGCGFGFGINNSTANPYIDPYRNHRYYLESIGPLTQFAAYAKKCDRPSIDIDVIKMHHGQDEINMSGKQRWAPIEVTFYEVDGVASALQQWASQKAVNVRSSITSAQSAYKMDCNLAMLDGMGNILWSYKLYGVWPSKVTPCPLSYTDTEISEVTATLQINKAIEE